MYISRSLKSVLPLPLSKPFSDRHVCVSVCVFLCFADHRTKLSKFSANDNVT